MAEDFFEGRRETATLMDVFVPTYNSEKYLEKCLAGVKSTLGSNISIVDHHSTDSTLKIAEKHGATIYFETEGLAEAIQVCCEKAETRFFAIIDSDVELTMGSWLLELQRLMLKPHVGGIGLVMHSELPAWRLKYSKYWLHAANDREVMSGDWVNAYIVRKEAVRNIHVPFALKAYNHIYLRDCILKNGFVLDSVKTNCTHHYDFPKNKSQWLGAGLRQYCGLRNGHYWILNKFFLSPFKAIPPALAFKDPLIIVENTHHWLKFLRGYLQPERYIGLKREVAACLK